MNISSRAWKLLCLLAVMGSTAAVFWPVVQAGFLGLDDDYLLCNNPHLRGLDAASLRWMFIDYSYSWRYHPLTWMTWFGIYDLAGLRPAAFHAAGLVVHVLNAALVFGLLRKLFLVRGGGSLAEADDKYLSLCAALGALAWAMHSQRLEAVAWVAAFVHTQGLLFMLLSLVAYLYAFDAAQPPWRRRLWYWGSVVCLGASMLSFPIAAGMAGVLLAMDYWPLGRFSLAPGRWWTPELRRAVWLKVPYLAVVVVVFGISLGSRLWGGGASPTASLPLGMRMLQAAYVWGYYLWSPWLSLEPPTAALEILGAGQSLLPQILSAVALVAISLFLWCRRNQWPMWLALWGLYLAALFPMCGWLENPHFVCDRYSLMAGVCWSVLLVAALWHGRQMPRRMGLVAGVGLVVLAMAVRVPQRLQVWNNGVVFFADIRQKLSPKSMLYGTISFRLGDACLMAGDTGRAAEAFRDMIEHVPTAAWGHARLGVVYAMQGRKSQAERHLQRALALDPDLSYARLNLAIHYSLTGRETKAVEEFREVLRRDPANRDAQQQLDGLLKTMGQREPAGDQGARKP